MDMADSFESIEAVSLTQLWGDEELLRTVD